VFLHAYFLLHPIARGYLTKKSKGAIMEGLNMGIIKEMPIPRAPIELQEAFTRRVSAMSDVRTMHHRSANGVEELFQTLQHRAFRGDL
jgi:type I restriction enzyme, S subunit